MTHYGSPALIVLLALPCAPGTAPAAASEAIERCAAIDDADARLACYDLAAGRTRDRPAAEAPSSFAPAAPPVTTALTPPDASTRAPPAGGAATPAAVSSETTGAAGSADAVNFGLTPAQLKVVPSGPDSEQGRIAAVVDDRVGHAIVTLDNGQAWLVSEPDGRVRIGQAVTIKRAALGSFMMTTADRHAYKVRRTH